jgi:hypothetical protein
MNILQVGGELFHEDGRTDRQTDRRTESGQTDKWKVGRQTDRRKWTDRRRMDGQAVMAQLIVTSRNFTNVLKIKSEG